jgi:hypothetical protein
MESSVSATARRIARYWAEGRDRSDVVISGYARQVQDHLDHSGDPEFLNRLAAWMSVEHPDCHDIDLAMRYANAPRPLVVVRTGHPCLCRGGTVQRGGAPAPAILRQLIRRPHARAA